MTAMTDASTTVPAGLPHRPLNRADLDAMPDDGHCYELIDGVLVVSPAPRIRHQDAVAGMYRLLFAACPADLKVLFAPVDVALSDDTVMQPDLVVARREDFTEHDLPTTPVLAVEVLSRSTRAFDLLLKRDRLQRPGCAHYWVVDPDVPTIWAWKLVDDVYVEVGHADGDDLLTVSEPFPLEVAPSSLADGPQRSQ
ncbi:Uma2 family endonuclease [Aeromicrobium sp. UC242_57]|uniref:Uma2 family endonuclease n=1 Tax=Aeromicrobium sp. UC242_57 TaxID=3374624 RepID=UPI00378AEF15